MALELGQVLQQRLRGILQLWALTKSNVINIILIAGGDSELSFSLRARLESNTSGGNRTRLDQGRLSQVSHHTMGGVTDWKDTISTSGWDFTGWHPKVCLTVSHVIKYLDKPVCCEQSPAFAHIGSDVLLPIYGPWTPSFWAFLHWKYGHHWGRLLQMAWNLCRNGRF